MTYVTRNSNGDPQIDSVATFCGELNGALPADDDLFVPDSKNPTLFSWMRKFDDAVKAENAAINPNAFNNVHGNWYEWLLTIAAWNTHVKYDTAFVACTLPNVKGFDCARLYAPPLYAMIQHLRAEVTRSAQVQLISSNPDFVIIEANTAHLDLPRPITSITPDVIRKLDFAYDHFKDQAEFGDIRGYAAVKTSFRPDRRLQIPHEGSLMKALYVHLQTRLWITQPTELRYYAITAFPGDPDRAALRTVATHSITTVSSKPQSAVDEVYKINSMAEAEAVFLQILNP